MSHLASTDKQSNIPCVAWRSFEGHRKTNGFLSAVRNSVGVLERDALEPTASICHSLPVTLLLNELVPSMVKLVPDVTPSSCS